MTVITTPTAGTVSAATIGEQAAALRAGLSLLKIVNTVPLSFSVSAHRPYAEDVVELGVTIDCDSSRGEKDIDRLAGFRAAVDILGLAAKVTITDNTFSATPAVYLTTDTRIRVKSNGNIRSVPVHLWIYLTNPDVIATARQAFTTPAVAA